MNSLIENNMIEEKNCGNNFSYILCDDNQFSSTEYKVLQSQGKDCFVKTMKILLNGNIQLYYLLSGLKSLENLICSLDSESFLMVISNLMTDIIEIKNNGFLSCRNIDISFKHIYVDPSTYKVRLVYLPATIHFFRDEAAFENELRSSLVKLISNISSIESPKTIQFSMDLSNGMLKLQDLLLSIKGGYLSKPNRVCEMQLVAMDAPENLVIDITKDEFVIGKKVEIVDKAITFNKMISRVHCKINKSDKGYFVTDLQSSNGTYVNCVKLQPNMPYPVNNGDIVRLANSDFQIIIKR